MMALAKSLVMIKALVRKESRQMIRDKSTLTLGILLPAIMLLMFGYGLSLDVKMIPVAFVRDNSAASRDLFNSLKLSPHFNPSMVSSWKEAKEMLSDARVDAIIRRGANEDMQIIVNGRDSNKGRIMQAYIEGAVHLWHAKNQSGGSFSSNIPKENVGRATGIIRIWYNNELNSRYFLVPGVTALIMTMIGALLTALVVAREWERGTYEALIATPVRREEFIIGKIVPYFALGMLGLSLCIGAAIFIFNVPMRGSLGLIIFSSAIYLLVSLGMGLLISAALKNQLLASQMVLVISYLPTMMLSGFIFDLKSTPVFVYYLAHMFPAAWYVDLLQTLFLVGNIPNLIIYDLLVLSGFAIVFLTLAGRKIRKSME